MTRETTSSGSQPVYEVEEKDEGYLQGFQDARDELSRRLAALAVEQRGAITAMGRTFPLARAYRLGRADLAEKLIADLKPRVVAKYTGWCPGEHVEPNPCTCSCYGCKFHCAACWRKV